MIYVKTVTKEGNGIAFRLETVDDLLTGLKKDKEKRFNKWIDSDESIPCPEYGFAITNIGYKDNGELSSVKFTESRSGGLFE